MFWDLITELGMLFTVLSDLYFRPLGVLASGNPRL